MLEKTLVILKPCTLQRGLVGEITHRFERKGLRLAGMKMMQLTDELLSEHYAHLSSKPFFQRVKDSMMTAPVIVCGCYSNCPYVGGSDKWTSGCPGNYSWGLQYELSGKYSSCF